MEHGSIEREMHIQASPEVVYAVISRPEHMREWWPADAELEPVPGASGTIWFRDPATAEAAAVPLTVVEADPPRRFSFRWVHGEGETAGPGNSLLVTFDLSPSGSGTLLRFSEVGFREMGWETAVLEQTYREHSNGWEYFLPRLVSYAAGMVPTP
jgi:uncharacterized protein YndB with AHSA1/START domain